MKYRKKPVVIEAIKWNPDDKGNQIGGWPRHWTKALTFKVGIVDLCLFIPTLEGEMRADKGDFIIQGIKGEMYPCKPDIFEATYEAVEESK